MPRFEDNVCSKCGGETVVPCSACSMTGQVVAEGKVKACAECGGDLYMECPRCEGTGTVTKNKMIGRSNRKR